MRITIHSTMKTILILTFFVISFFLLSFKLSNNSDKKKLETLDTWKDILIDGKDIAGVRSDGTAWVWKNGKTEQVGSDKDWEKFFFLHTLYLPKRRRNHLVLE